MKSFKLPRGTRATLTKATPRKEHHGDELRQAISLRLRMECSGDALNALHPNLQDMLLWRPPELDAQADVPGVPVVKPVVRRLFKFLPVSIEMQTAVGLDEMAEHGITQQNAAVIDGDFAFVEDPMQLEGGGVAFDLAAGIKRIEDCTDLAVLQLIGDEVQEMPDSPERDAMLAALQARDDVLAKAGKAGV